MSKEGTVAIVATIPMCDICKVNGDESVPAQYDAKTKDGPWANLCVTHFTLHGVGLGVGLGQKLVLEADTYRENPARQLFECALHRNRHPLNASWDCYDDLFEQAVAETRR